MHVDFIDQTVRDGQQSLWGLRMRAYQAKPALAQLLFGHGRKVGQKHSRHHSEDNEFRIQLFHCITSQRLVIPRSSPQTYRISDLGLDSIS